MKKIISINQNSLKLIETIERCYNDDVPKILYLIENGTFNLNIQNSIGFTALIVASAQGYTKLTSLLLEKGADPFYTNTSNGNPYLMMLNDDLIFKDCIKKNSICTT